MLSPGRWHEQVPKGKAENLRFRLALLDRARGSPHAQALLRQACKEDLPFYINSFVYQYNPSRVGGEVGPFVTWDFQDEACRVMLDRIRRRRDLLIEKSREMGASWLCLIVMDWCSLFHPNKDFLCVSHSEQAVDRSGDKASLFWKLDFMHQHLPEWLIGKRPRHLKLRITYPQTHSSITGAATTERSGVGGRFTAVFLDEFSKQRDDFAILGQTADTGPRVFNGTHYGVGTAFFELSQRPDLDKLQMHWSQHPDKNPGLYRVTEGKVDVLDKQYAFGDHHFVLDGSPTGGPHPGLRSPWYDAECQRRASARDVAMHLDINPTGSVAQFFDPLTIRVLQETYGREPYWEGDLQFDPDTARPVRLVPVAGGPLRLWLNPEGEAVPRAPYGMGGDIAAGTGATPSCLSVGNARTGEKVAEYVNAHIPPDRLAVLAVALCWLFKDEEGNGAMFCWEMQGPGVLFGKKVIELGYRNVYFRRDELGGLRHETSTQPGWVASPNNQRVTLEEYRAALHSRQFLNRSRRALQECLAFKYDPSGNVVHGAIDKANDPSGARVSHGDLVIADALDWKMMKALGSPEKQREPEKPNYGSLAWRRQLQEEQRRQQEAWA